MRGFLFVIFRNNSLNKRSPRDVLFKHIHENPVTLDTCLIAVYTGIDGPY